jgi:hypothetical protein
MLFQEEAERARRYAAEMTDKKVIDRLNEIAALYDELAAGQHRSRLSRLLWVPSFPTRLET